MSSLPALPEDIDPDAGHVERRAMQCRTCEAFGPVVDMDDKNDPRHLWDSQHYDATGHERFYAWTMTRNTSRIITLKSLRRKGRS